MAILVFILLLSALILIHEFGHFSVAKKLGIRVEEFGLGLPPRLIGKKVGETIYSLNLLPFGGFVRLTGEDVDEENQDLLNDPRSFISRPPLQRGAVIIAGVVMHTILAIFLFYIVLFANNFKTSHIPLFFDYNFRFGDSEKIKTVVSGIQEGSAAEKAGIELGEAIVSVDGISIEDVYKLREVLKETQEREVQIVLKDLRTPDSTITRVVSTVPDISEEGLPILGVYLTEAVSLSYQKPLQKVFGGFLHSYNVLSYSLSAFKQIISISVAERSIEPVSQSVSGPVGIYSIVGGVLDYGGNKLVVNLLDFTGLMAISLAFINILPFPALDGGRLVFIIFEYVSGKKLAPSIEGKIHKFGMAILLFLLVAVTFSDIFS